MEESERRHERPGRSGSDSRDVTAPESTTPSSDTTTTTTTTLAADEAGDSARLDVCSEHFDPLLALYSPSVSLPFPNLRCFNNVAEYEGFLKGGRGRAKPQNVEKKLRKAMKGVADPERIERLRKLMVNNPVKEDDGSGPPKPRRRNQRAPKNVLTRMPLCKGSPLGVLHRCVEERIRVKVHIRSFKGLRGVCSGFVVAFDKFWNMAMVDVDETYGEPLLGEAFYHEKALTVSRLFEKLRIQESSEGAERVKQSDGETTGTPRPETTRPGTTTQPPPPGGGDRCARGGAGVRDPRLSRDTVHTVRAEEKDKRQVPAKAQGPVAAPKKVPYGRVHTRHIKQLFIRGENVLLVNPQPL